MFGEDALIMRSDLRYVLYALNLKLSAAVISH